MSILINYSARTEERRVGGATLAQMRYGYTVTKQDPRQLEVLGGTFMEYE